MKPARYVAFLRAINVGGHVVTMDRLRREFEALGFSNVETFIASGNVVFETKARDGTGLEKKIAARLERALGYEVATFVRTMRELAAVAGFRPAARVAKGATHYVGFIARPLGAPARKALQALGAKTDSLHTAGREIHWFSTVGFARAGFSPARMERDLGIAATFRNVTTVRRMAATFALEETR